MARAKQSAVAMPISILSLIEGSSSAVPVAAEKIVSPSKQA
jgi:hypothetical protein